MSENRRVLLLTGSSRAAERGELRGIARYSRFHGRWIFYREPPFYRKPPYHISSQAGEPSGRFRRHDYDGVIAFGANSKQIEAFLPAGMPCVIIPIMERIPGYCCITEESRAVGRMAAEHFLERGFTQFAFCGFDHMYWSRVRLEGFVHRVREAGFTVHVYEPVGASTRRAWTIEQAVVADWLKSLPKPIGLMACNDDRAQQVIEANSIAGVRIPDEVAVLGVDDDDMICELADPPLSSIALDFEEAGYEAAAQLDLQMEGQKPSVEEIYLRPTHVHIRQSTDVLAVDDQIVADALHFIRNHPGQVLSVRDVAEAASTSRRLLERHFRQSLGVSLYKEIQRVRIQRACQMLAETNWSLAAVAKRCGFSSQTHFTVAFKRLMHMTPTQHRRQVRPRASSP